MPTIPFTVRKIDSLKSPSSGRVDYWDEDLAGFGLRISDRGLRTWTLMYRTRDGRQRRIKLGTYPVLSLASAREAAKDALHKVSKGNDPAEERDTDRHGDTIADLADLYMTRHAKKKKRSWQDDDGMLKRDVLPAWGKRPAKSITRRDIRKLLDKIVDRGAPIMANRTYEVIRRMFRFAVENDIVDASPCFGIEKPGTERQRDRVLTEDEIRAVWKAIEAQPAEHAAVMKLRLLTAQRGGEVRAMRWSDIDRAVDDETTSAWWTIPGEFAKNGKSHRVFLTAPAIEILRSVRALHPGSDWVLPGRTDKAGAEKWYVGDRVRRAAGVDFRPHDLRRTAASMMTGMGIPRLHVAMVLNHAQPGATAIYDRHSYDPQKQQALEAWAERLLEIIERRKSAGNIVKLRPGVKT